MSHNLLVGGFASSERQTQRVADVLAARQDEDFAAISFREAMVDRERLERMARGADVVTHSAGMLAIRGAKPESITAIAPPVPVWAPLLAARAIASGLQFAATDTRRCADDKEVAKCVEDAALELALHLPDNVRWLWDIAGFDALKAGVEAQEAGISTGIAFMTKDKLFQPSAHRLQWARRLGLKVVAVSGTHEDFLQRPRSVLNEYEVGVVPLVEPETEGFVPPLVTWNPGLVSE